jgi:hypothetical protein
LARERRSRQRCTRSIRAGSLPRVGSVTHLVLAIGSSAVGAAEDLPVLLESVTEHPATAVAAHRCDSLGRTLEAIEGVCAPLVANFECLVVVVAAKVASRHRAAPFSRRAVLQRKPYLEAPTGEESDRRASKVRVAAQRSELDRDRG